MAKPYPHDFSFLEVIRAFAIILIPAAVLAKLVGFLPPIEVPSKAPSLTQDDLRHQWVPWAQLYGSAELGVAIAEAERREDQPGHTRGFEDLLSNDLARAITPTLEGARRCPGSVILGRPIHIAGERAQQARARIKAAALEVQDQFPLRTSVEVGYLTE